MKKCIKILNRRYLDYDGKKITIGGIQTYITSLASVAESIGMSVELYQLANKEFEVKHNNILIHGIKVDTKLSLEKQFKKLYKFCMKAFDIDNDLMIFGSDIMTTKIKAPYAISIQHGIGWDVESEQKCSRLKNVIHSLRQFRRSLIYTKCVSNVKKLICVDYNYINWYRTQILYHEMEYEVIPNFTKIPKKNIDKFDTDNVIKIIFARRLVKYRGTRLFANVIERLLKEFNNLEITFAGDGPEEEYLRDKFKKHENVNFITYESGESLQIHKDKHIAVIPTIGSEGTSLSLLEAMASTCAVVCTNVGGMTNIVVDNYNGLSINPSEDKLYEAMKKIIEDKCFRKQIAEKAFDTVQKGFSYEIWAEKWKKVLSEF